MRLFRFLGFALAPLSLSALPLHFEPAGGGAFVARTSTQLAAFTRAGIAWGPVRLQFVGAPSRAPEPLSSLPGRSNYLIGPPSEWRTAVPHYAELRYREIYPRTDLVFYGGARGLEYDFRLSPAADPQAIRLRFRGASSVVLEGADLVVRSSAGELRHHRPAVYQEIGGARHYVNASWRLRGREASFDLAPYDRTRPLVIDPVLVFASYAGGSGDDYGAAIAVDSAGNVILAGTSGSPDFPSARPSRPTYAGFLAKLDPTGARLLTATYIAGAGDTSVNGVALDSAGNIVIAGLTLGLASTPGAYQTPGPIGYVAKFPPSGDKPTFISSFGAAPSAVAVDPTGNIYVTGAAGAAFRPTTGALQPALRGNTDAFVLKLSADGSHALYATYLGGADDDSARAIGVDAAGEAYLAGDTASSDFPVTPGAAQTTFGGRLVYNGSALGDAFVAKLDASGANLLFATYLGGSAYDSALAIGVTLSGEAVVSGTTQSANFPVTAGVVQPRYAGGADAPDQDGDGFVARFSPSGALLWATYLGGSSRDAVEAVAIDSAIVVYVAGSSESADFPRTSNPVPDCRRGVSRPFAAELARDGSRLIASTGIGGLGFDRAHALALDFKGGVYLAGETHSLAFFATGGAAQPAFGGGFSDVYAAKLNLAAPSKLFVGCALNAASFQAGNLTSFPLGTVAPGEVLTIFGTALGPDPGVGLELTPEGSVATTLAGTRVLFDGVPAPMLYAGANQLNVVVPYSIKAPVAQMTVERGGVTDGPRPLPVADAVPAIFTFDGSGIGQAAALNEDNSYNTVANPAPRGTIITFYAEGAGVMKPPVADGSVSPLSLPLPATQLPVTVQIRGVNAEVIYSGAAPGYVSGLLQINARIPPTIEFGDHVPLSITVGNFTSQLQVTIAVK